MSYILTFLLPAAHQTPFRVTFKTDQDEVVTTTAADANKADVSELAFTPGGIVGFWLNYRQVSC